ncbi:MAG: hypothetical protein JXP34_12710, partial [Planctomycetes bacterium]|nr:hypothetical protein [Planctomycetota bacterium]
MPQTCPCAPFDRAAWDGRTIAWKAKPFFREKITLVFGVPVDLPGSIRATHAAIRRAGFRLADPYQVIERDRNPFGGDILIAVQDPECDADPIVRISGMFLAHVHMGPYGGLGRARRALRERIRIEQGIPSPEILYWYANCPACWDAAGGPATVMLVR